MAKKKTAERIMKQKMGVKITQNNDRPEMDIA